MSTDWRALCAELADALDHNRQCLLDDCRLTRPLADKARAALAEPVGEGVTDEELLELAQHHSVSYTLSDGSVVYPLQEGCDMRDDVLSFARAVLARWGHHPAPPDAGEVGELVAWLRLTGEGQPRLSSEGYARLTRAADLLEQRHPVPVPVAARLPGAEDCDAEERCWLLAPRWILPPSELTHWLPATALPLPAGEVQP